MAITVENERLCSGVIADEVHLSSPTIPFSVPAVIDVMECRLGIESGGSDVIPHRGVINNSRAHIEVVEV